MSGDEREDLERGGLRPLPLGLAAGHTAEHDGTAGIGPGGRHAIGGLARGARGFATRIGLGFTARRAGLARAGVATGGLAVRPPVDFWPGGADEPHPLDRVRTGDPAYDRLVNQRRASAAASTAATAGGGSGAPERVGRGLPASIHRRGRTIAGPRTAPGAGGMRPGEIRPAPNEATRLAPSSSSASSSSIVAAGAMAGAGPRSTVATGARPRMSSGPGSGSRSGPTGGSGHPGGGSAPRGRSTADDPGGADADLAALRAAIIARRDQQTGAEDGRAATSSPAAAAAAESTSRRPPSHQHSADAGPVRADSHSHSHSDSGPGPGPSSDSRPRAASGADSDARQAPADDGSTVPPSSAAEGLPVRHVPSPSPAGGAGSTEPTVPADPRPPSRPVDPRSSREAALRGPGEAAGRHDTPRHTAGHDRIPLASSEIQRASEPDVGQPGPTPDTSGGATLPAADATGPTATSTNAAPTDTDPTDASVAAAASGSEAVGDVPDIAPAGTGDSVGAGVESIRPSAAEGLPVRFSGLVSIEAEQSGGPAGDADRPSSPPAADRPAPPDSIRPASRPPGDDATGSAPVGGSPTGSEPIRRATDAAPSELRSAAEGLPVRGTTLPVTSGDHRPPPPAPGSSAPPSTTAGHRPARSATSNRPASEQFTQTTIGDRPRSENTSHRAASEHLTRGTVGDGLRPTIAGRSPSGARPARGAAGSAGGSEHVGDDPGGRFLSALGSGRPDRSTALPGRFRPLARALIGGAPVRLVTGAATRRALDVVGSAAATVGRTIYLAEAPGSSPRHREILAHELVHAARPSPVPRFFADPRPSAEERLAHDTGRRMAAGLPLVATSLSSGRSAAARSRPPGPTTGSPPVTPAPGPGPILVRPGRHVGPAIADTAPGGLSTAAGTAGTAARTLADRHRGFAPTSAAAPRALVATSGGARRAAAPTFAGGPHGLASALAGTTLGPAPTLPGVYRAAEHALAAGSRATAPPPGGSIRSADPTGGGAPFAARSATASVRPTVAAGLRRAAVPLGAAPDTAAQPLAASATGLRRSGARVEPPLGGRAGGVGPDLVASISRHAGVLRRETSVLRGFRDADRAGGAISTPPTPISTSTPTSTPTSTSTSTSGRGGQRRAMGTDGLPVGGLSNVVGPPATTGTASDAATARRQTVHREQARRPGGDPTAAALTTAGGGGGGGTPGQASPQTAGGGTPPPTTGPTGGSGGGPAGQPAAETAANPTPAASAFDDIDRLVELLEERLLAELERRGARFRGGPF